VDVVRKIVVALCLLFGILSSAAAPAAAFAGGGTDPQDGTNPIDIRALLHSDAVDGVPVVEYRLESWTDFTAGDLAALDLEWSLSPAGEGIFSEIAEVTAAPTGSAGVRCVTDGGTTFAGSVTVTREPTGSGTSTAQNSLKVTFPRSLLATCGLTGPRYSYHVFSDDPEEPGIFDDDVPNDSHTGAPGLTHRLTPVGAASAPLVPARLLDSRPGQTTADGISAGGGAIGPGQTRELQVTGRGGVPATGVGAVVLNVTATGLTAASFLTVFPTGYIRPNASNLNVVAGQTVPNLVIAKVGDGGQVSIYNDSGSVHVIADVAGWLSTLGGYDSVVPARLLDTRAGQTTVDGIGAGGGAIGPGQTRTLQVTGRGNVPADGVGAVVLNVTATQPTAPSFLTVFPTGSPRPNASNLNVVAGQTVPNLVIAKVGDGGLVSIYNDSGSVQVIADVAGWFPTEAHYSSLVPARLLDTRPGEVTTDGLAAGGGAIGPGVTRTLQVTGRGGVPATGVGAVVLNVTATGPTAPSFLTVFPTGSTRPNASNLNVVAGQTVPNLVVAKVGDGGSVSIYNDSGAVQVIADVAGWFATE
jgi:hypothetical protein